MSPNPSPTFRISCDGTPFPFAMHLLELDTTQSMDGSGSAILRLPAASADGGWDAALQAAPLGAVLEVALGHHPDMQVVFTGSVHAHRLLLSEAGVPEAGLEAASQSRPAARQDGIALTVQYGAALLAFDAERTSMGAPAQGAAFRVRGQATMLGTTAIRPGGLLALGGLGDAIEGSVRVLAVRHLFSRGGWTTRADFSTDGSRDGL